MAPPRRAGAAENGMSKQAAPSKTAPPVFGCLQEQGDRAVHQQQSHDPVDRPGVPDEEDPEQGAEGGPEQGEQKADPRQQQGEGGQGQGPAGEVGEDVGLHGHDPVDVDLGVDELEQQAGPEAAVAVVLGELPAPEGLPGQKEHIGRPQDQHGQADAGDQGGQQRAEGGAQQHDGGEARPDAEVEGEGPPEAQAAPVGHGHEIVGAGGGRRDHRVGEKRKPGEHL